MRIIYIPPFSEVYRHRFYQTKEMVEYNKTTSPIGQEEYSPAFTGNIHNTFCTMLYNADVDIKTAQAVLGHSDVSVTLSIYTHLAEKQKKRSIDKLNDYVKNEIKNI